MSAPVKLSWEEIKALRPVGPVPIGTEVDAKLRAKKRKREHPCRHTWKHRTATGGCRKCNRGST